ncbi:MAG TPA: HlyD family efflux transporter periplasmic adaptor subunit [Cellvibrio sp.]|nr:HlyD family efflux transporter periplasmic adaptor subunit [Cellvibrio sp.]
MKTPRIIIAAVAVTILIVAFLAWNSRDDDASGAIVLHGNVDIRQVSLAFEGSGRVVEMRVEEGDHVKAGDVVAVLDTQTMVLQAEQARALIEVQQQNLLRLRNGSRPQEIEQARSRLAAAQVDTDRAEQDLKRFQGLAASRVISVQDLDKAKSAAQIATAKRNELRDALRLAEAGSRSEDVAGAEAQLKSSEAQLALLQHQIDVGELKAPADAVVRARLVEVGDMATAQRAVFALALTQPKWVRVYVSEVDLGKLKPGMTARVVTDSHPDQAIAGKIGYISSVAEFTPKSVQTEELRTSLVYEVRVLVNDPNDSLRLGQPATVTLASEAKSTTKSSTSAAQ